MTEPLYEELREARQQRVVKVWIRPTVYQQSAALGAQSLPSTAFTTLFHFDCGTSVPFSKALHPHHQQNVAVLHSNLTQQITALVLFSSEVFSVLK